MEFLIACRADSGRYPSGHRGQTVNLLATAFGGSNPPLPTISVVASRAGAPAPGRAAAPKTLVVASRAGAPAPGRAAAPNTSVRRRSGMSDVLGDRGNSSAVERQPSKLGVAGS